MRFVPSGTLVERLVLVARPIRVVITDAKCRHRKGCADAPSMSLRVDDVMDATGDSLGPVRLGDETTTWNSWVETNELQLPVARCHQKLDPRPASLDLGCERDAVNLARQIYVREDDTDVAPRFKEGEGLFRRVRLQGFDAVVAERLGYIHVDENFVLDDEGHSGFRCNIHGGATRTAR